MLVSELLPLSFYAPTISLHRSKLDKLLSPAAGANYMLATAHLALATDYLALATTYLVLATAYPGLDLVRQHVPKIEAVEGGLDAPYLL